MTSKKELRIGVNGFGRIGRAVTRILLARNRGKVVHVNDVNPDNANLAYLLKYDTTYGRLAEEVTADESSMRIGADRVQLTHQSDIAQVDWEKSEVDVVIEATGVSLNEKNSRTVAARDIPVIVTHACPSADFTLIFGVTDSQFDPARHKVVSTSICDANAAAPVLKALNDAFGIESGFVTSLHPWLSYQNLMDGPSRSQAYPGATYSHYALGRSSVGSLIPKPTTLVTACERALPELKGVLKCMSYRVPTACVSSADMTLNLKKSTSEKDILELFKAVQARQENRSVIRITDEPLISVDYLKDDHSCIIDTRWLMLNQESHLKVVLWYDNEWGYSSRVADTVGLMARRNG